MNRTERRALARTRRREIRTWPDKQSHFLLPQVCTLYVPEARGYVADYSPTGFRVVEVAELAKQYVDDDAENAAFEFRALTGLRVAIRPYYCPHVAP
jgi:hypothetical protein